MLNTRSQRCFEGQVLKGGFQSTLPSPLGGHGGHEELHPRVKCALPGLSVYSHSYIAKKVINRSLTI